MPIKAYTAFSPSSVQFKPRDHQKSAAIKIADRYAKGWRGFLLADKTGIGKTLSGLAGVTLAAKKAGFGQGRTRRARLLIVCPSGVIPTWIQTLEAYSQTLSVMQPVVLNYEQLYKLQRVPPQAKRVKKASTKRRKTAEFGKPVHDWDFVIFDESHKLKNYPSSSVSLTAANIAKLDDPYTKGKSPFVVFSTATPGVDPLNLSIMAGVLAPLIAPGEKGAQNIGPKKWPEFLKDHGFSMKRTKSGWSWASIPWFGEKSSDPEVRRDFQRKKAKAERARKNDILEIQRALKDKSAPFIMRSPSNIAGWPERQTILLPVDLNSKQRPLYEQVWSTFREFLKLPRSKKDSKTALVETLRYRQKSSLLKVESMMNFIREELEADHQIYISCEFIETIDEYKKLLSKRRIPFAEMSGRTKDIQEQERLRFQKGQAKVVLCTVMEGVSLHAEQDLPDGTKATSNTRTTIVHDVRQNPLDADQTFGRAHRDGQNSIVYVPFFRQTADEKVVSRFAERIGSMKTMLNEDDAWDLRDEFSDLVT